MRQIKRRFRLTMDELVDEQFFSATKNEPDWKKFKKEDFSKRVSAAYDIKGGRDRFSRRSRSRATLLSRRRWAGRTRTRSVC